MAPFKMQIKPLSEGVGLGSLIAKNRQSSVASSVSSSRDPMIVLDALKSDESTILRQAHAAYAPNTVAAEIRMRPTVKYGGAFVRFIWGFGLDVFVATFTTMVVVWAGVLAWSAGATGAFSVVESMSVVREFLFTITPVFLAIGALFLALCWRGLKLVVR